MKRAATATTAAGETTALERIMTCLTYRFFDARKVLVAGYDLRLPEADAMISEACIRYLAGLQAASADPVSARAHLIARLDIEYQRQADARRETA